ncbi:hypothetical protein apy_05350 [Aeropyrum pernix]|uniref:Amidohydrolase-related domain-containing protein n=2 Tax=Aeropyrum pernix TaxID=56636 RepID=A0A401H8T7_AERPX|nr:hypothetical protein apy_05350 [Aeropyrum pernix]
MGRRVGITLSTRTAHNQVAGCTPGMVDILVTASRIYTGREVLGEGYIYVRDGVVTALGEGVPPEDLTYPTITLGGRGRIAAPGLALAADTPAYLLRFLRPSVERRVQLYRALGHDAAFTSSLPAVYELHLHGVTTVFIEYITPDLPARLAEAVGGRYGLLHPSCPGAPEPGGKPPALAGVVSRGCGEGGAPGWALESLPVYRPSALERPWSLSEELRREAGLGEGVLREGSTAEIAVFDSSRPPGMLLDRYELSLDALYRLGLQVESLVSGSDILVDGGEHLYIVEKHFSEAYSLASRLAGLL